MECDAVEQGLGEDEDIDEAQIFNTLLDLEAECGYATTSVHFVFISLWLLTPLAAHIFQLPRLAQHRIQTCFQITSYYVPPLL